MSRHLVTMKRPASWHGELWREALMLGNGLTGVLMHGAVAYETIQFNRWCLWQGSGEHSEIPDLTDVFTGMREKIAAGDYLGANTNAMANALKARGYDEKAENPFPLGTLTMESSPEAMFRHYERGIDLQAAEAFVRWKIGDCAFERRAFVSRDRDVTVIQVKAEQSFSTLIGFALYQQGEDAPQTVLYDNEIQCRAADGAYGAKVRVEGTVTLKNVGDRLQVTGKEYRIFVKTFARGEDEDFHEEIDRAYEILLANHCARYSPLYNAVSLKLASDAEHEATNEQLLDAAYESEASPALLEKLWRFGRYLFLSATADGGNPIPLYGLWHGGDNMTWSQYVANENVQMTYWHALAGGMADAMRPLIHYYFAKMERFREAARNLFGMNGIWVSAYTTPNVGGPCVPVDVILCWMSGAGWLSQHFWDYYRYTGDETLLRAEILPFMREAAQFYLDYAQYNANGELELYPSVSPENSPRAFIPERFHVGMGHPCPAVKNATMDFAVMKELLTNLLEGIRITGIYVEEAEEYRALLSKIPAYQINEDGAVKEWMAPELEDYYCHRHLSHVYPVFPGNEVNSRNDPELFEAFRKAVQLRQLGGQSGWSLTHMASIYARMGESERSVECLDLMAKSVVNNALITMHNDWRRMGMTLDLEEFAPIQLDANFGAVNAIQEMLFRAGNGVLFLLPACPKRLKTGRVYGIVFPQGGVDLEWNAETGDFRAEIYAKKPFSAEIVLGKTALGSISLKAGEYTVIERTGANW